MTKTIKNSMVTREQYDATWDFIDALSKKLDQQAEKLDDCVSTLQQVDIKHCVQLEQLEKTTKVLGWSLVAVTAILFTGLIAVALVL
jgi:hypothetical protein